MHRTSFVPDHLPRPGVVGAGRVSGISLDSARIRTVLAAVVTLAPAPGGFTVADLTTKVHALTGKTHYTTRQGAYDLRKLPGKHLIDKPGRGRRYQIEPIAVRTVTALLTLREQVIAPILAGVRDPDPATATTCTAVDRDYQHLRTGHARPVRPSRDRHRTRSDIDNILSIMEP